MKPYSSEEHGKSVMDIINENDPTPATSINLTPGETKRIELIRKMKSDTDKIEYMIMLNALMIILILTSIWHFMAYRSWFSIGAMGIGVIYFYVTRVKLRSATLKLSDFKNDFDKYLWEGFHLKEMRHSAIKLAYLMFFPLVCILVTDLLAGFTLELPMIHKLLAALSVSTIGWLFFFEQDKSDLKSIETDLKALAYL
jgi:hypothetical protein